MTDTTFDPNVVRRNAEAAFAASPLASWREACRAADIDSGSLSKFMNGKADRIEAATLAKLSAALGTTASALLGEASPADNTVTIDMIDPPANNPRRTVDDEELASLTESVAQRGILQNLIVVPRKGGRLEVVAGERRYRAMKAAIAAGRRPADEPIPVRIIDVPGGKAGAGEIMALAVIENDQRAPLAPLEEAEAFDWFRRERKMKPPAIAETIGRPGEAGERYVQLRLNLIDKLDATVKGALAEGRINLAAARALTAGTKKTQRQLLDRIVDGQLTRAVDIDAAVKRADAPRDPKPEQADIEDEIPPDTTLVKDRSPGAAAGLADHFGHPDGCMWPDSAADDSVQTAAASVEAPAPEHNEPLYDKPAPPAKATTPARRSSPPPRQDPPPGNRPGSEHPHYLDVAIKPVHVKHDGGGPFPERITFYDPGTKQYREYAPAGAPVAAPAGGAGRAQSNNGSAA